MNKDEIKIWKNINNLLDNKNGMKVDGDVNEYWKFELIESIIVLTRYTTREYGKDFVEHKIKYYMDPKTFPRKYNGESYGIFFYRHLNKGFLERIRIFYHNDTTVYIYGDIRHNITSNVYKDWELETNWYQDQE